MESQISSLWPLLAKLELRSRLGGPDRAAVLALPHMVLAIGAGEYIVREGEQSPSCYVMLSGFAQRHKLVGDRGRQIVGVHLEGDIIDCTSSVLEAADSNVQALTSCRVAEIPLEALINLSVDRPAVARAMWADALAEMSVFREWIANIGRRDPRGRVAHILCEMSARQHAANVRQPQFCRMPMNQEDIGDAVGLAPVHVNRALKSLELEGVISREGQDIVIDDWEALVRIGDFNPDYLHLAA
jgi:CRP-like cAMP-binding protein